MNIKKPNFTAGPWKYYHKKLRKQYALVITEIQDGNGKAIVMWSGFDGLSRTKKETAANAKLIAASPLLAQTLAAVIVF